MVDEDKPKPGSTEARWLEPHEAALLLEVTRTCRPNLEHSALPFTYPLLATFLLTGGQQAEVLGLEVDDVSFKLEVVHFRPNHWRRLKTKNSHRRVPLWPQLREILSAYMLDRERQGGLGRLLFPSPRLDTEGMASDLRKAIDLVAVRAGWKAGEIRTRMLRHTYATARLQTLDNGAPISVWTVARELGHSSTAMIERRYGHVAKNRHRAEVVEFRLEQHREVELTRFRGHLTSWEEEGDHDAMHETAIS